MFSKSAVCVGVLSLFYFFPAVSSFQEAAQEAAPEKTPIEKSLFGSGEEGIVVYRKNNRSERYRGSTIYHPEIQSHHGQMYIVGHGAPENHSSTYMFQLDGVELIRIPNPEFKEDPTPATKETLSLQQQVYELKEQHAKLVREISNIRKVARVRSKEIEKIESSGPDTTGAELERLELIKQESEIFSKQLGELEEKAEQTESEFLKKRLEAVTKGVYDKDMDGIR